MFPSKYNYFHLMRVYIYIYIIIVIEINVIKYMLSNGGRHTIV